MAVKTICLDAGHGLKTPGKRTPDGIHEWTLNDKVRDYVVEYLKDYDVNIIHADGDEGNTDESLASRLAFYVNKGVDAFVSIHHNANTGTWNSATGVEVFTDRNNTAADMRLAEAIYKNLPSYTGLRGRGIKKENWWVINQNRIPAVLVEGGFMDGTNDYKVITSEKGQRGYARAVAEGLVSFLGLQKKNGVKYSVHVQNKDWMPWKSNGEMAGTTGQSLRMEAIKIDGNANFTYQVHVQNIGDMPPVKNGQIAGTTGKALRMEAIKINCDKKIMYRVHVQNEGWTGWVSNGAWCGTKGKALRLEAIEIKFV